MTTNNFILATAGHVDHGKSALVLALTGTDPDRLPEEKARGLTIELGFAHLTLQTDELVCDVGVIDVPGHEDFVKNMVVGVGSIDAALLLVAADDGWMPQTEEHLQILSYLGVQAMVVAVTKIDLIPEERRSAALEQVAMRLKGTRFAASPCVATSVLSGHGLDELRERLTGMFAAMVPAPDIAKPRLPVDRVFTMHGIGTVITGTLTGGSLRAGQSVTLQPSGRRTRIRGIQSHRQELECQVPGTRTAVHLHDVSAAEDVGRGDVLTGEQPGSASDTVDVELEMSERMLEMERTNVRPIEDDTRLRFHHGSSSVPARVRLLDVGELLPGERSLAQLRLESPVFVCAGDRFILRDWPERMTLAGGTVLDPGAKRARLMAPQRRAFLQARADPSADASAYIHSQLKRDTYADRAALLAQSRFSQEQIEDAVKGLEGQGLLFVRGESLVHGDTWRATVRGARETTDHYHEDRPERPGMPLTELKGQLKALLPTDRLFDGLIDELCQDGYVRTGAFVRRADHEPVLPPKLKGAGERLREALSESLFEPPAPKELAPDPASAQALRFLLETGEAVQISPDLVMSSQGLAQARDRIRDHLAKAGASTLSDLRKVLGSTRRVVVPLVEFLDSQGFTTRHGDKRRLKGSS